MSSDTDNTALIQILSGIFTYVRNVRSKLFHTSFRFTDFKRIFIDVYRCQYILTNNTFVQHYSILIIISFPRHESHFQILTQSQFPVFGRISFCKNLTGNHTISLMTNRTQIDSCTLICLTELRYCIFFNRIFETNEFLVFSTIITNTYRSSIDKFDHPCSFSCNLRTRVTYQLTFKTCTYDRSLCTKQRYGLTHHVRSHQCTVSIIMFKERN